MRWANSFVAGVLLFAGFGLVSCASTNGGVDVPTGDDWVDNPSLVEGTLASVGSMVFVANEGNARTGAEADARAKLAATLKAEINSLVENWAKEAGNLQIKDSLSSMINNENFTRQYIDTVIRGTRAVKYRRRDNNMHVLMTMEPDKVKEWYDEMADVIEKEALRDAALWKTEALKSDARDRFDKIKKDRQDEHIKKIEALRGK